MTKKERYSQFAQDQDQLPLFLQAWWLEAAMCEDGDWDAILLEVNNKVVAALPYCFKKRFGITNLFIPWCTAYLSAFPLEALHSNDFLQQLPPAADYRFRLFPGESTAVWKGNGYSIKPTKTHLIKHTDIDLFKSNITAPTFRQIKKAEKQITVSIAEDPMPAYRLWQSNMQRKKVQHALVPENVMLSIDEALAKRNQRQIWEARDNQGTLHAAIYIAQDLNQSYYLWGGYDINYRTSGANSLLFYQAIIYALASGKGFDFEGSMVESVAKFYKGFGAEEVSTFSVHKTPSILGKIIKKGQ